MVIDGRTLLLRPQTRQNLGVFGKELPAADFAELFGEDPFSIGAFSDYSGDAPDAQYEVFATYVVSYTGLQSLLDRLRPLHEEAAWRTIDFKGRKDALKARVLERWLAAFRNHPGLCIALCWDKRSHGLPQSKIDITTARHALGPFGIPVSMGERMVRAFSYLAVIGHMLREKDRFLWVSDEDAILRGNAGKELPTALAGAANQMIGRRLQEFQYTAPLDPAHRVILTLPDLVAGTLASTLGRTPEQAAQLDPQATTILSCLTDFANHTEASVGGTRLLIIKFPLDAESALVTPHVMRLSRQPSSQ